MNSQPNATLSSLKAYPSPGQIVDTADLAFLLACHPRTVNRLVRRGVIPSFKLGRVLRFDARVVLETLGRAQTVRDGGE